MSPLGQEVEADGVESKEAIYQRQKGWSMVNMTRERSNGQSVDYKLCLSRQQR